MALEPAPRWRCHRCWHRRSGRHLCRKHLDEFFAEIQALNEAEERERYNPTMDLLVDPFMPGDPSRN
jgi:hypothetical protein